MDKESIISFVALIILIIVNMTLIFIYKHLNKGE